MSDTRTTTGLQYIVDSSSSPEAVAAAKWGLECISALEAEVAALNARVCELLAEGISLKLQLAQALVIIPAPL